MSDELQKRLRCLRLEKRLSQQRYAEQLGLPRGTYTHYELGRRTPDLGMLMKIADSHLVSLDYLVGYTEHRPSLDEWAADHPDKAAAIPLEPLYPLTSRQSGLAQIAEERADRKKQHEAVSER